MDHQGYCWCCIGSVPQSALLNMLQQHPKILTFVVCDDGHTHQWRSKCLRKWACTCTTQCATTCPSSVPVLCTLTAYGCPVPHCGGYRIPCCWQESSFFSQLLFPSFSLRSPSCHPPPSQCDPFRKLSSSRLTELVGWRNRTSGHVMQLLMLESGMKNNEMTNDG